MSFTEKHSVQVSNAQLVFIAVCFTVFFYIKSNFTSLSQEGSHILNLFSSTISNLIVNVIFKQ